MVVKYSEYEAWLAIVNRLIMRRGRSSSWPGIFDSGLPVGWYIDGFEAADQSDRDLRSAEGSHELGTGPGYPVFQGSKTESNEASCP